MISQCGAISKRVTITITIVAATEAAAYPEILHYFDKIYKTTLQNGHKVVQSSVIYCVSEYTDGT